MGEEELIDINEILMDAIEDLEDPATQVIAKEYEKNCKWGMENLEELKKKYGGKLVLILDQRIIFADEDHKKVRKRFRSFFGPSLRSKIVPFYIPREDEISSYG